MQTSCELFQLQRDEDAEPVIELKDGGEPDESADSGDDQPQVADRVAVDRPTVETVEVRRQPRERDGDNNQRNENPATTGIFAPADSETAASGKGEAIASANMRMMRPTRAGLEKKVVQSPQPQMTSVRNGSVPPIPKARFLKSEATEQFISDVESVSQRVPHTIHFVRSQNSEPSL